MVNFGRYLWIHKLPTKSMEIQLTGLVTFLMGVFGGALTLPPAAATIPALPAPVTHQSPYPSQPSIAPSVDGHSSERPRLNPEEKVGPPAAGEGNVE